MIYFLVKREFVACKDISEKHQRELYEIIYSNKIHLGLTNDTYTMVRDYIKAKVKYNERNADRDGYSK